MNETKIKEIINKNIPKDKINEKVKDITNILMDVYHLGYESSENIQKDLKK